MKRFICCFLHDEFVYEGRSPLTGETLWVTLSGNIKYHKNIAIGRFVKEMQEDYFAASIINCLFIFCALVVDVFIKNTSILL